MNPKRIAICIGINKYCNFPKKDLLFAVSDAEQVNEVLKNPARGAFEPSHLLTDSKATKVEIINLLEEVLTDSHLGNDDIVLIYFSGHAKLDDNDDLYLVPHDVQFKKKNT